MWDVEYRPTETFGVWETFGAWEKRNKWAKKCGGMGLTPHIYIEESTISIVLIKAARISGQDVIVSEVQQRGKGIKGVHAHIFIK